MSTRQLGVVREALQASGMEISYAFEDLIFLEQNGFLLQFTEQEGKMRLHTNCEADEEQLGTAIALLQRRAKNLGLHISMGSRYRLSQEDDQESIRLELFNRSPAHPPFTGTGMS